MAPTFSLLTAALLVAQNPAASPAPASTCPCQKNNNNVTQVQYVQPVPAGAVPAEVAATSGSTTVSNDNHPILNRIRGWFRKDAPTETSAPVVTSEPPTEQKRSWFRMPSTTSSTSNSPTAPSYVTPTAAPLQMPASQSAPLAPVVAPSALPAAPVKIVTPVSATTQVGVPVNNGMIATPNVPVGQTLPIATVTTLPGRPSKISPELVNKVGHDENYSWITGQIRIENGVHVLHYATPETVDRFNGHVVLSSSLDMRNLQDGAYVCVRGSVAQQANNQAMYRVQALDILNR